MNAVKTAEKLRAYMWSTMEVMENHKDRKDMQEEGRERIETFQAAELAVKKQIPEEPFHMKNNFDVKIGKTTFKAGTVVHKCFSCGELIRYKSKFCHECGQAIKW